MTSMKRAIWAVIIFLSVVAAPYAEQWPQFRGLRAGSIPDNPALPERWSETENVVWKLDLPGRGWSSPVVWDDHILLTAVIDSQEPRRRSPTANGSMRTSATLAYSCSI
jgi:hypothetical protein